MATPIRFLLDEDIRPLLAETLRDRGFDVVHVLELGLSGRDDLSILREATRLQRVLLTHNVSDFATVTAGWAKAGEHHCGVLLAPQMPFKHLPSRVLRFLATHAAEDLKDATLWIPTLT